MATTEKRTALELMARANVKESNPNAKFSSREGRALLTAEIARLEAEVSAHSEERETIDLRKKGYCPEMPSSPQGVFDWLINCAKNNQNPKDASNWDTRIFSSLFLGMSFTQEQNVIYQFPGLFN